MRLTEEYKRITEHFKDLQAKFSHFQQADLNKYQAVRPPNPYPLPASWVSVTCMCSAQGCLLVHFTLFQVLCRNRVVLGVGRKVRTLEAIMLCVVSARLD